MLLRSELPLFLTIVGGGEESLVLLSRGLLEMEKRGISRVFSRTAEVLRRAKQ